MLVILVLSFYRYLKLNVVKLTDTNRQFTITLSSCSCTTVQPILFRKNGIIGLLVYSTCTSCSNRGDLGLCSSLAPLSLKKATFNHKVVDPRGANPPECQLTMHKPHSITCVRSSDSPYSCSQLSSHLIYV